MVENQYDRVIVWLHLEDREEHGDHDEDGRPITWTREVWKRVTIGHEPYGPESLSRSVTITQKDARKLLRMTDVTLTGALYKKLGVDSLRAYPGLPKGPYYDSINLDNIRSELRKALGGRRI